MRIDMLTMDDDGPDRESVSERFSILKNTNDASIGGKFDHKWLARVRLMVENLIDKHHIATPFIYGTPELGVQIEWTSNSIYTDALFTQRKVKLISFSEVDIVSEMTDDDFFMMNIELDSSLDDDDVVLKIVKFIRDTNPPKGDK